jgi:uncharacterized protein YjiS (DUF1127 family)
MYNATREEHDMKTRNALASLHVDDVAQVAARPAAGLDSLMRTLVDGLTNWNGRQMDMAALRRMDNRMLEDIGLTRADLDRAA